jgi:phage shock protein E
MKGLFFLFVIVLIGYSLYYYAVTSPYLVSSEKASKMIENGEIDVILDVRSTMEYNLGHFGGAVHIPVNQLKERALTELPDRNVRILIYCNTGQRSRAAAEILRRMGYQNVVSILGAYWTLRPKGI